MKLVIDTQYRENYGDESAPYWKCKGGDTFIVDEPFTSITPEQVTAMVEALRPTIEWDNPFSTTDIISWQVVPNDFISHDEQMQLEYDGRITDPSPRISLTGVRL